MEVKTNRNVSIMEKHGSGVKVTKLNNAYRLTVNLETKRFQMKNELNLESNISIACAQAFKMLNDNVLMGHFHRIVYFLRACNSESNRGKEIKHFIET